MPESLTSLSLYNVWQLYQLEIEATYPAEEAKAKILCAQTALLRYTLPGWGYQSPQGKRMTAAEIDRGLKDMKSINLELLSTAREAQAVVFEDYEVTKSSARTYRHALNQLMEWYEQQPWSIKVEQKKQFKKIKQDYRAKSSRFKNQQGEMTQSYEYGLGSVAGDQISPQLEKELEDFKNYRLGLHELSYEKKVSLATVEQDLKKIRLILGWKYRYRGVPSEQLTLISLFQNEKALNFSENNPNTISNFNVSSITGYLDWLKAAPADKTKSGRGITSRNTIIGILQTIINVAKYLSQQETSSIIEETYFRKIVFQEIQAIKIKEEDELKRLSENKNKTKKLLTWYEYLELTEILRQECIVNNKLLKHEIAQYSIQDIALRHQRFILASLYAYVLPYLPQLYRNLEFNDSSTEQPDDYIKSCLAKKGEQWYLYLVFHDQKSSIGILQGCKIALSIPNIKYSDGRYLFNYLDEWLQEYYYAQPNGEVIVYRGLREVFSPKFNTVFIKTNGYYYEHETEFNRILQNRLFKLTDKPLNFTNLIKAFNIYDKKQLIDLSMDKFYNSIGGNKKLNLIIYIHRLSTKIAQKFVNSYHLSKLISAQSLILLMVDKQLCLITLAFLNIYPRIDLKKEDYENFIPHSAV